MPRSVIGLRISGSSTVARAAWTASSGGSGHAVDATSSPVSRVARYRMRAYDPACTSGVLSDQQLLAWRRFLRAHALVTRRLESDLMAEHQLPLASYDVLVQLVEAPERRLRMSELAERVLLSRSGLTRLVDRLEREGLVAPRALRGRRPRALHRAHRRRLRPAARGERTHLRGVLEHGIGRLDDAEAQSSPTCWPGSLDDHQVPPPRPGEGQTLGTRRSASVGAELPAHAQLVADSAARWVRRPDGEAGPLSRAG